MVVHLEILLAPECYDKVSYDDTGRQSVFRGIFVGFRITIPSCFSSSRVTPHHRITSTKSLEEVQQERIPEYLSNWAKGVTNGRGGSLQKFPFLLK